MSDALLSPAVGGAMWLGAGAAMAVSAKKIGREMDSRKVPLMGVLAAFVFAGQMINFTIPGTGSSGHLGGGIILAALLGPHASFLAMASILTVQALFFADGGLLALGCNIVNLGFFPAFVAYPLFFRPLAGREPSRGRLSTASLTASVAALLLGALGVVLQTTASGVSELPFASFAGLMLPIHFAIGIVEGLVTAAVVSFVWKARPEVLRYAADGRPIGGLAIGKVAVVLAALTLLSAGGLSWLASTRPDGLEWAVGRVTGGKELPPPGEGVPRKLGEFQERTALMPDYNLPPKADGGAAAAAAEKEIRPEPSRGTSLAGIVGSMITLLLAAAVAWIFRGKGGTMSSIAAALNQVGYLDTLASQDTFVHRLDPRAKLLVTLVYVLAVVSFGKYEISAMLPFAVYPLWLGAAGNIPLSFVARKLAIVSPFILFVGIFNPLLDREVLLHLGSLEVTGGWVSFFSIVLRATLTLSAVMLLLATTGMNGVAAAADRLGAPRVFVVQLLFLYRYLFVLVEEALRLTRARSLRSFGRGGGGFRAYASLLGHLLLRTLDRAERIYQAMLSRGFDGEVRLRRPLRLGPGEGLFAVGWVMAFVAMRSTNLSQFIGGLITGATG